MNNSAKFFSNKSCEYYPCHEGVEEINCLFCYCPLYNLDPCPGENHYIEKNGKKIKVCTNCTFPHKAENYQKIIDTLKSNIDVGERSGNI